MTEIAKPVRTPWGLVVLLGSLTAMGPLAIDMYLPSLPSIGADLNASAGETQATVSAFLLGMGVGQFFYGPASTAWDDGCRSCSVRSCTSPRPSPAPWPCRRKC
jgi:MFS family permease